MCSKRYKPHVSIGLPVYNGERFLDEAIRSILNQTYRDFELIITDNASTDKTKDICLYYVSADPRVRYYRNVKNLGAAKNYNRTVLLANGDYFKWHAHDDLCSLEYLEYCVSKLDENKSLSICHSKTGIIDENGKFLQQVDDYLHFMENSSYERYRKYLFRPAGMWNAIFGLTRINDLKKTKLIGSFPASDQITLGELILAGKVFQIENIMFYRRKHEKQSWRVNVKNRDKAIWFDSENSEKKIICPKRLRLVAEHVIAIKRAKISSIEKKACYYCAINWGLRRLAIGALKNMIYNSNNERKGIWQSS